MQDVAYFLQSGVNVNAETNGRWTPLHHAASGSSARHVSVVRYLIAQGANVNATSNRGERPLDVAALETIRDILREAGGVRGWSDPGAVRR